MMASANYGGNRADTGSEKESENNKALAEAKRILKRKHDDILQLVDADIESARLYYEENIQPRALERLQRFYCDKDYYAKKFPGTAKRGMNFTMSDVADTIYWILPSLMRVFFGSQDPISMEGRTPEDDPEAMKQLCNWQLQKKNKGFRRFYNWFLDALQLSYGVIKVLWERETEEGEESVMMTPEQFMAFDPGAEGVEFIKAEEQPDGSYRVTVKVEKITKNQPTLYNVPISEFWYLPGFGSDVKDLPFVTHRRKMTRSEIETLVKEKTYEPVSDEDYAAARVIPDDIYDLEDQLESIKNYSTVHEGASSNNLDKSRQVYWVYECFGKYDFDGDNISECWIVTKIGSKIVRLEKNPLKRPPFCVVAPYPDQYEISGLTIDDMIGEIQDIKTAVMRQVLLNVANNNDRQVLIDPEGLNMDDVINNRKYIRRKLGQGQKMSDAFQYMPESPLASAAMTLLEIMEQTKENRTGITKYNQGLDSKSLNKTATGVTAIMGAANQRIEMIARMLAETGVIDLFEMMVELNLRYIDNKQVIRLTNGQSLQIDPEDLEGHYDLDVAAGVGAGQRQEAVQNMMLLLSKIYPAINGLIQTQGLPGVAPEKIAAAATTLVQQMGYKDASKYAPTIDEIQAQLQQMMEQAQAQQAQAQMIQEIKSKAMRDIPLTDEELAILEQVSVEEQQAEMGAGQPGAQPNSQRGGR